jgi:hypothetical protein
LLKVLVSGGVARLLVLELNDQTFESELEVREDLPIYSFSYFEQQYL